MIRKTRREQQDTLYRAKDPKTLRDIQQDEANEATVRTWRKRAKDDQTKADLSWERLRAGLLSIENAKTLRNEAARRRMEEERAREDEEIRQQQEANRRRWEQDQYPDHQDYQEDDYDQEDHYDQEDF